MGLNNRSNLSLPGFQVKQELSCVGRQGPAVILGQHCSQMTRRPDVSAFGPTPPPWKRRLWMVPNRPSIPFSGVAISSYNAVRARHHFHTMMSSWGGNGIPGFFLKLISHEKGTFLVALLIHRIFGVRQRRGTNPQTLANARKGTQILLSMTQAEPGNIAKDEKQQPALCNT